MRKIFCLLVHVIVCIILLVNLICCRSKPQYYTMEDFDFVVVGKTTMEDIFETVSTDKFSRGICTASYGATQNFKMEDGRFIEIKYMGPDMVVFSIEIVDEPF